MLGARSRRAVFGFEQPTQIAKAERTNQPRIEQNALAANFKQPGIVIKPGEIHRFGKICARIRYLYFIANNLYIAALHCRKASDLAYKTRYELASSRARFKKLVKEIIVFLLCAGALTISFGASLYVAISTRKLSTVSTGTYDDVGVPTNYHEPYFIPIGLLVFAILQIGFLILIKKSIGVDSHLPCWFGVLGFAVSFVLLFVSVFLMFF